MKIQLLGSPTIRLPNHLTPTFKTTKGEGLFYYLVVTRQPHSRAQLATLFWGDTPEKNARASLSKALSDLREQVGEYVTIATQTIVFTTTLPYELDVESFLTPPTPGETPAELQARTDLYRGELLDGFYVRDAPDFEQWLRGEREQVHNHAVQLLTTLATRYQQSDQMVDAMNTLRRLLRVEPWREEAHYQLITLLAQQGETSAALRQYELCRTALADELDVEPGEAITQLYTQLRTNGKSVEARERSAVVSAKSVAGKLSTYLPQPAIPVVEWAGGIKDLAAPQPELAANVSFVGRQAEWQTLQARWQLTLRGQPQFVLIAGEAGIGKTRLAEELLTWAHHHGLCTVRSRCYAAEGRLIYAPVIEWLRSDTLRPHRNKVPATWLTELARLLPELLTEQPNLQHPELITPTWLRHHLFEAAARALLALDQPLILLIDDLQWCDKETLELLHFLLRNAATLHQPKVLLVGTARLPDEVEATHPLHELLNALRSNNTLTQLDLARLSEAETSQLAHKMIECTLDNQTLHQLFLDTAGNPLFVVEMIRATKGQIAFNRDVDTAPTASLPREASEALMQHLPPKVLTVIQVRLGQLSPTARELCEWAAIVGRSFTLELLTSASKIAEDKVVNALDELWQRRIIREQGTAAYDFSHDRIRDVAAAGISLVRRRYLHRCVAEALENENVAQIDRIAAILAVHFDKADMVEKSIYYYEKAAKQAPQVYAHYEAVPYLQRAIVLLKTLPESKERDQRELTLLTALAPPLSTVAYSSTIRINEVYEQAYALSQRLGISLPPNLLRIVAIHRGSRHDFAQAEKIGQQLLALSQQQDGNINQLVYLEGCYVLGVTAFWQGHFVQARAYLQQAVDAYSLVQRDYPLAEYGQDTGIISRTRLGWTLWYLGYPDQAYQQCKISVELAQKLQHPFTNSLVFGYSVNCAFHCGNRMAAEIWVRLLENNAKSDSSQSLKVTAQTPRSDELPVNYGNLWDGLLYLLRRDTHEGLQQIHTYTSREREKNPTIIAFSYHLAILAETYGKEGHYQQGLLVLEEAFSILNGNANYWVIAEMYRIKGELLSQQATHLCEAEACLQQALTISRQQQAKSLELRAAMSLARLWDRQGRPEEVRALLAEIYNWFTEGFDTADLQEAKALLAQIGIT